MQVDLPESFNRKIVVIRSEFVSNTGKEKLFASLLDESSVKEIEALSNSPKMVKKFQERLSKKLDNDSYFGINNYYRMREEDIKDIIKDLYHENKLKSLFDYRFIKKDTSFKILSVLEYQDYVIDQKVDEILISNSNAKFVNKNRSIEKINTSFDLFSLKIDIIKKFGLKIYIPNFNVYSLI